jgi:hypothetical protein
LAAVVNDAAKELALMAGTMPRRMLDRSRLDARLGELSLTLELLLELAHIPREEWADLFVRKPGPWMRGAIAEVLA